ncbi:MAG: biosynthetic-type acetolactate synthase large subunit [Christensenella sp.]|nr:biosynthetic-type acetolactate synthase large subunit [Christensenella sp.]
MKIKGADIIVETLIEQGCKTVFGYPGGAVLDIYDSLYRNKDRIDHVLAAHEQGATHAADGYARVTGDVGVVIATSGPGATNTVTGIATAYLDSVPMVVITGNVAMSLLGRDSFQEVDIFGVTMSITKHNFIVKNVEDLAPTIREAFSIAKSGRPGPVLIDVPKNIQKAIAEYIPERFTSVLKGEKPDSTSIKNAANMINSAERPVIYCGGGVSISNAGKYVMDLSKKINAPVACSMMGLASIPASFEMNLGMSGMHGSFACNKIIDNADLIIAIGARFSDRATGNKEAYKRHAKVLHIDIDPSEINKNINTDASVIGDTKQILKALLPKVTARCNEDWVKTIKDYNANESNLYKKEYAFDAKDIIDTVQKHTDENTVIATDVGQHQMWVAQYYKFEKPHTFLSSGGLGTMGYGMGAAIGGCIANNRQRTVLFTGDGSFGMNLNEVATAVKQNIPLTIVIMNNGVLGMVRQWQTIFYDKRYAQTTLDRQTDFVKLADAFGAKGFRVFNKEELDKALTEAFEISGPTIIDCILDKDEQVLPMIPPNGTIDDIMLR